MNSDPILFHRRPMYGAAAGAVLGVLAGALLTSFWLALALAVPALAGGVLLWRKRVGWGLLLILFALLSLRISAVPHDTVPAGTYVITGTVAEEPEIGREKTVVVLRDVTAGDTTLRSRMELELPPITVQYGDTISVTASVHAPKYPLTSAAQRMFLAGTADGAPKTLSHRDDAYGALLRLRRYFGSVLDDLYGDRAPNAKGMLLGDRSDLSYRVTQEYSALGILHIFAVSGLHMTALMSVFGFLIRTGRRWLDFVLLAAIAALYCALTAFTPSVLRAAFFLFAMRFANDNDRMPDAPSAYCFSAVAVLLLNPYALFSVSFLLSFGAMAGLLLLMPTMENVLRLPRNLFLEAAIASVAALTAVLPIEAYFFGGASWMTIPMSVLLAPALPVMLPLAFVSMLLAPAFPNLARIVSVVPYGALVYLDLLTKWIHGSKLLLPAPQVWTILLWYAGLILLSPLCLKKTVRPIGLGLLAFSLLLWIVL